MYKTVIQMSSENVRASDIWQKNDKKNYWSNLLYMYKCIEIEREELLELWSYWSHGQADQGWLSRSQLPEGKISVLIYTLQ
jgi:hypothetical protein